jgi:hypothetical protein
MPAIAEGRLTFAFPDGWNASKFDEWSFYRNQFQGICGGAKAIDILAIEQDCCWLIEIKDYRNQRRTKSGHVAEEVALKVRDTLAALAAARVSANDAAERAAAGAALRRNRIRVVLHLEAADRRSRLFSPSLDLANVQQRLKQCLKPIDAHPRVCSSDRMAGCAWNVA